MKKIIMNFKQMPTVFVYTLPGYEYMIVKNNAFSCHVPVLDTNGRVYNHILQGRAIEEPVWEWKKTVGDRIFGKFSSKLYDITDISSKELLSELLPLTEKDLQ